MSNNRLPISDLDFFQLKDQLKSYLKNQDRFKDFNFEGSNMSVLLDILSYNTYQNGYYNNMAISEMFMDSAQREDSVVSHAKNLNYLPRSRTSATTKLSFVISSDTEDSFIVIPRKTKFTATGDARTSFEFYTDEAYTAYRDVNGLFPVSCLEVHEGKYVDEFYSAVSDPDQKFVISNDDVDTRSVRVFVKNPENDQETEYRFVTNIFGVRFDEPVFYIQKSYGRYEVYFGRDAFGTQPLPGEIVHIEYRVSSGDEANGISRFSLSGNFPFSISPVQITGPSEGGFDKETSKSVKFFAPKSIQVQERAVTETDYEILLKNRFPEIQAVSVIGGENVYPPLFGKVMVYVDVFDSETISQGTKGRIMDYLKDKVPLGITPVVHSASFMHVEILTDILFDTVRSTNSESEIRKSVLDNIIAFSDNDLNQFGVPLRYSRLVQVVDGSNKDIMSNNTRIRAILEFQPSLTSNNTLEMSFGNELIPIADYAMRSLQSQVPSHPVIPRLESERVDRYPTVSSSPFRLEQQTVYVRDDGYGILQIIRNTGEDDVIVRRNVGTVDYKTGTVNIRNLPVSSYRGSALKIYADLKHSDVLSPKNKILSIRPEDVQIHVTGT
ncbi:MAG: hypothetical protein WCY93_08960 [Anaerolineaceae bacterium]